MNPVYMANLWLILANEFEKTSFQVSAFPNEPWKLNFLDIDFRYIDQNSQKFGKTSTTKICF